MNVFTEVAQRRCDFASNNRVFLLRQFIFQGGNASRVKP